MTRAVVLSAVRTPVGRYGGGLAAVRPDDLAALAVAAAVELLERGYLVPAIRPPTVPAGTARLRVSLSAAHAESDVGELVAALHAVAAQAR